MFKKITKNLHICLKNSNFTANSINLLTLFTHYDYDTIHSNHLAFERLARHP